MAISSMWAVGAMSLNDFITDNRRDESDKAANDKTAKPKLGADSF